MNPKPHPMGVVLPPTLDAALREQASREDRSLGWIVRRALARDLASRGHDIDPPKERPLAA